jgi:3-oxoadipate enol-lactonase
MDVERFDVDVPGGRLAGEEAGAGPPVVLLHGLGLGLRAWDDVSARLATSCRVVRYDLRGHDGSSVATAPYAEWEDLAHVLDARGLASAHVAGLSMGGGVALDFALAYPARVRTLTFVDTAMSGHAWSVDWVHAFRVVREAGRTGGADAAKRAWFAHPLFAATRAQNDSRALLEALILADSGARWLARDQARVPDPPAAARLAAVAAPALVVVGERDLPDFQAIAHALAEGLPEARLVVLPGVGHLPNLEMPASLAALIAEFVGEFELRRTPA